LKIKQKKVEEEIISKGAFRLDPESIYVGEIEVKLMGDSHIKNLELVELQDWDFKLIRKSTIKDERVMPEIRLTNIMTADEEEIKIENEIEALLTADLLDNKRISTETFIELQNKDEKISKIKQNLLGNPEYCVNNLTTKKTEWQ
jgi:hypothetical protein